MEAQNRWIDEHWAGLKTVAAFAGWSAPGRPAYRHMNAVWTVGTLLWPTAFVRQLRREAEVDPASGLRRPLSTEQELAAMKPIREQLPQRTRGHTVRAMRARCPACRELLPDDRLRGRIVPIGETRLLIEAAGLCDGCQRLTPMRYRVTEDGRLERLGSRGGWVAVSHDGEG